MIQNILLVQPDSDNESLWVTGNEGPEVRNNVAPVGLATIAALTPDEFHVDIWDELVHGRIDENTKFSRDYALVGITGFKAHLPRAYRLATLFRNWGHTVAIGGPGVSATPEEYRGAFDILFIGEAELTWPQFLQEWKHGTHKAEYRQIAKIDMTQSPLPKWDSIAQDLPKYAFGSVQTTRGCPFDCEFCDVIYLFGRRSRQKPVENVLKEVEELERLGITSIFFCDDEFIGNPRYTKELLKALVPLNNSFRKPLTFSTQVTMNLSKSDEMLELMADANFDLVFIGIETPNQESLKEASKFQNVRKDLVGDVHKVLSYGISIRAGAIVGFDHDQEDIFDRQYDFIQRAYIPSVAINMLKAPWGTRLWARLRQEGRVVKIPKDIRSQLGHPRSYTTILPKGMSRVALMKGYRDLLRNITTWESFADRACGFVSNIKRPPQVLLEKGRPDGSFKGVERYKTTPEATAAIDRVISTTQACAPYMLDRARALIGQHAKYLESIHDLLPQLDRQIELESSGTLVFHVDTTPIAVPYLFRKEFKKVFPDVYRRVYINLKDPALAPEAAVEVFVDFLVRWGDTFEKMEDHHLDFFSELCDRTCAKFNGVPPESFVSITDSGSEVPDTRRSRLDDDVLKSVEQVLSEIARENTRAPA